MGKKMKDIFGTLSAEELNEIDENLDKAEELAKKHHIYIDEAQSIVSGHTTLNEVLNKNNNKKERTTMKKLTEAKGKVIKEIDWNGHHYTFANEFHRTGTKNHDVLTMTDENGNEWVGETTWINRPWHKFDLEEAFDEIVKKAFGNKALELVQDIDSKASSVENAIDMFFDEFEPTDINDAEEDGIIDDSTEGRKNALAEYLGVDADDIEEVGDNEFECDEGTYLVLTDDEADEKFDENVRSLWDEGGLEYITEPLRSWIIDNAIDEDALEEYVREYENESVYDMEDDEVIEQCIDADIISREDAYNEDDEIRDDIDVDDLREKLIEDYVSAMEGDFSEYLKDVGFEDEFFMDYIDEEKAIEAIKDDIDANGSGRGQEISYYDGNEIDLGNDLYAYRTN